VKKFTGKSAMELWDIPIIVAGSESGVAYTIGDSRAAIDFLLMRWPCTLNQSYQTAIYVCGRAIADRNENAAAQEAFIAALSDADIAFDFMPASSQGGQAKA
jgi:hypothetical protein